MTRSSPPEVQVDTNVLVRLITDDPVHLADRAEEVPTAAQAQQVRLVVSPVIVADVVYVLTSFYRWPRRDIGERLLELIDESFLAFLERRVVAQALSWFRDIPAVHFADAYLAALSVAGGTGHVLSFDRALRRLPGITVVESPEQLPV